jgi:hypothetical protein
MYTFFFAWDTEVKLSIIVEEFLFSDFSVHISFAL